MTFLSECGSQLFERTFYVWGIGLGSPIPFPTTITVTLSTLEIACVSVRENGHLCKNVCNGTGSETMCVCMRMRICTSVSERHTESVCMCINVWLQVYWKRVNTVFIKNYFAMVTRRILLLWVAKILLFAWDASV